MPTGRPKEPLVISTQQEVELKRLSGRPKSAQALALRCRIVLRCAGGDSNMEVAESLGVNGKTVGKWRRRFLDKGVDGLLDEPRPGTPRTVSDEKVEEVITLTLESTPREATHWSTRLMSKRTGLSNATVGRIWRAFGLQPHRVETFKLSTDPLFIEKVRDVVGLYLNPPENAVVLCVDEKSQIQALDRTQPTLPMRPGQVERRTHDYRRHGTTTLFSALNKATGEVLGRCYGRHRSVEFRRFLDEIERNVPKELEIHIVLDNYGTHKTALIRNWLLKRPRFHLHFTPTSASWLNLVERWFAELTNKQIKRGSHRSVKQLVDSINRWMETWNEDPRPYVWTKSADQILESLRWFCERTSDTGH